MAPKGWTTDAQRAFLTLQLPEYFKRQREHKLGHFWPGLFAAWFSEFSERKKLTNWFRNASGQRSRKAQCKPKISLNMFKPAKKRSLNAAEIYSQHHYDEKIKPIVQPLVDAGKITRSERLAYSMETAAALLKKESPETQEKIEAEAAALKAARKSLGTADRKADDLLQRRR